MRPCSHCRPQFGSVGCEIKPKARELCVPVDATVSLVTDGSYAGFPADDLAFDRLCYRVKCAATPPASLEVGDGFGTRNVEKLKISTVCTPAVHRSGADHDHDHAAAVAALRGWRRLPGLLGRLLGSRPDATSAIRATRSSSCACVLPCNELDPDGRRSVRRRRLPRRQQLSADHADELRLRLRPRLLRST